MASQEQNEDTQRLPVKFDLIRESLTSPIIDLFPGQDEGMVRGEPGGFVFTREYGRRPNEIYQFQPREDDVWVCTFSKSGTTWTQELVWLIANNCDTETAKKTPLHVRSPYLEGDFLQSPERMPQEIRDCWSLESMAKRPSPRIIKSHLPFYLLPPKLLDTCKVVYVARNPKDVIVSNYHHFKLFKFHDYKGTMEQFAEYSMNGLIYYSPYFPHVLEAWNLRHHPNVLFLFYEEMKQNLRAVVERVAAHLNKTINEEQMIRVLDHLSFKRLAEGEAAESAKAKAMGVINEDAGTFFRKGKAGDWKNHYSPELNERIDKWMEDNLAGCDLKFIMELDHQD
ncbi:sulfotransferase 1A3-like isoform X1 [Daphnia carinata]|uniref:sulfotransferase 1A3-like isoform X1 n=1 Tax=Daphnia carinata TaxID=120202 RepID=UPI00257FEBF2|nr:sulfotransferase 1A3-like isoform X1 [Daphnia carinata]